MQFTMYSRFNTMVYQTGLEATADFAAKMGFSSVELLETAAPNVQPLVPDVPSAEQFRRTLAERGLTVACYSVGANLWQNPGAVDSLKRHAELAAALGSPFLHHTLLLWLTRDENSPAFSPALKAAVDRAEEVARYAETLGLTCLYEDQGAYVNGVENFGLFYNEIHSRCGNTGICGDLGNSLFVNEPPEEFLAVYGKEVRHVHIKDYLQKKAPVSPGQWWLPAKDSHWLRDTTVGSGVVDFAACIALLKEAGYTGSYSLELEHPEPFEAGIRQAMEYLRRF